MRGLFFVGWLSKIASTTSNTVASGGGIKLVGLLFFYSSGKPYICFITKTSNMNTPISFELAKLLKEKGFDSKIRGRIHVSHWHLVKDNIIPSNVNTYHNDMFAPIDNWNDENKHFLSLPTITEVVMWIYEKHGIWISVKKDYHNGALLGFESIVDYNDGFIDCGTFDTSTKAYEAAIEYTLTKLIP